MQAKVLVFDFRVFGPIEINYAKGLEYLIRESNSKTINPASKDFFGQLSIFLAEKNKKLSQKEYKELSTKISELLDEIETSQISNPQLYPGVKNGLESLKSLKLFVAATTEMGAKAAEKFLEDKGINSYVKESAPRRNLENAGDLGLRINNLLQKTKTKSDECIYFCNRLEELKAAKSKKIVTVVLPSKGARMDAIMRENPDGMIMTLEELPAMLSLDKFKKPDVQESKVEPKMKEEAEGEKEELPEKEFRKNTSQKV